MDREPTKEQKLNMHELIGLLLDSFMCQREKRPFTQSEKLKFLHERLVESGVPESEIDDVVNELQAHFQKFKTLLDGVDNILNADAIADDDEYLIHEWTGHTDLIRED